jgi:hypothetical protein
MNMEDILKLEVVKKELDEGEIFYDRDNDTLYQSYYLGTVFNIMPSGKYYMPWACSNVTEEEAQKDEDFREKMEEELETINAYLTCGEGDPCDMIVNRPYANLMESVDCSYDKWCSLEFKEIVDEDDKKFALFECKHDKYRVEINLLEEK